MSQRNSRKTNDSGKAETPPVSSTSPMESVEQRVIAFAEQVGRLAGTVQAKSEGWFDRQALSEQLASIRDSAADMVEHLAHEDIQPTCGRLRDVGLQRPGSSKRLRGRSWLGRDRQLRGLVGQRSLEEDVLVREVSTCDEGESTCSVLGSTPCRIAMTVLITPATPAAACE